MLALRARRVGAVELTLLVLLVTLSVAGFIVVLDPRVSPATVDVELDVVFTTIATLVAGAVAIMNFGRYREGEGSPALLRASAFTVLAILNAWLLIAILLGLSSTLGLSLADPGQLPLAAGIVGRGMAAGLLVAAGAFALRGGSIRPRRALLVGGAPALAMVALLAFGSAIQDRLPELITADGLRQLAEAPEESLLAPAVSPLLVWGQTLVGIGFLVAAALSYRLFRRDASPFEGLLSVGLTMAAFSQVHSAIHPGAFVGLVTTGDVLRVGFYSVLLAALIVESRSDARALRIAHADLRRLRDAELATAATDERARLAREIHDGLAQDLWYAKLKQSRLLGMTPDPSEARLLAGEVVTALDSALAEARQAVMALRPQLEEDSFTDVVRRYVEDFGDRFGIRAEHEVANDLPGLAPRAQAEVLRILQEALNNVRKHADATVVRVRAMQSAAATRFEVTDNGVGFDPSSAGGGRYGLQSMRERAELVGGTVGIDSEAHAGTRVWVEIPRLEKET